MVEKCPKGSKLESGKCVRRKRKKSNKIESTGMKIFLGIALALIFFGLFNLGVATFYDSPEYDDYCTSNKIPRDPYAICASVCTEMYSIAEEDTCIFISCGSGCGANGVTTFETLGQCETALSEGNCGDNFEEARDKYNSVIFYIFVIIGVALAIAGLFIASLPFQIVGIGAGTAMVIEGILRNLQDKIPAFVAGVVAFIILSYFVWRKFT